MNNKSYKDRTLLYFRKGVEDAGFSSSKTSNANNADSTTIVRELIQNSLDAAKALGREKAKVRFVLEDIKQDELPSFKDLKTIFPKALKTQEELSDGKLPDIQKQIAENFKKELDKETGYLLSIQDNGVGLDRKTMQALLGDGRSLKAASSGGAHGYGHLTVLPASNLRLVYYGGINKHGHKVASGHCILAPFKDEEADCTYTKDGFIVNGLKEDLFEPYDFLVGDDIPSLIDAKINFIKNEWKTGTVVIVPSFNFFKSDPKDLLNSIKKAAATNFFASFFQDELFLEYVGNGENFTISKNNIEDVLNEFSDEKNARSFISGAKALECLKVISTGENITFETVAGKIEAKLIRHEHCHSTRIDLCRNGMWIVYNNCPGKQLPRLQNATFSDFKPFHLVLLSNSSDGELHDLIRKAEPPIHDQIDLKQLIEEDQERLKKAFGQIQDQIKDQLEKIEAEHIVLDDILSFQIDGESNGGGHGIYAGEWEPFERNSRVKRGKNDFDVGTESVKDENLDNNHRKRKNSGSGGGTKTKKVSGHAIPFNVISVPIGPRQCEIEIYPLDNITAGEIRFMIDQNMDATCRFNNAEPLVALQNIKLNSKIIPEEQTKKNDAGKIIGIFVPNMEREKKISLQFEFEPIENLSIANTKLVGIKAEIIKRKLQIEE